MPDCYPGGRGCEPREGWSFCTHEKKFLSDFLNEIALCLLFECYSSDVGWLCYGKDPISDIQLE